MYDVLSNKLDIAMVIEEDNFTVTLMFYTDRFTYHRRQTMKYIHKCNYIDVGFLSRLYYYIYVATEHHRLVAVAAR